MPLTIALKMEYIKLVVDLFISEELNHVPYDKIHQ